MSVHFYSGQYQNDFTENVIHLASIPNKKYFLIIFFLLDQLNGHTTYKTA